MNFLTKSGTKNGNPKDKILFSQCPKCGYIEALLLRDWLKWARFKGHIEDLHYPIEKGLRGRLKLVDFLVDGLLKSNPEKYKHTLNEVCKIHKIPE